MTLEKARGFFTEIPGIIKQVSVEPFVFFLMFGHFARLVSQQSILNERSCILEWKFPPENCTDFENEQEAHTKSMQMGTNLYLGIMVIATLPAFVVSMFLGSWSDIYGRKYTLILASSGLLLNSVFVVVVTAIDSASPYMFLVAEIPSGIFGGMLVCISSSYSFMSDITSERTRPTRYAILEFFMVMAMPIGTLIGGQVYAVGGYIAVMVLSTCGYLCAFMWAFLMIKETRIQREVQPKQNIIRDLVKLDNVVASFSTCTKKRPGNLRLQLWFLVIISCTVRLVQIGKIGIGYNFAHATFGWGIESYSNIMTLFYSLDGVSVLLFVPIITKKYQLHEAAVGLIGIFSMMAKLVLFSVSFQPEIFYYAWCSGVLGNCSGIATRSRLSKLVSKQELGRVFSLLATCESLTPVLGSLLMSQIFNATVATYPGLVFAVSSVLLLPSAIIFVWMTKLPTMSFAEYCESEDSKSMRELNDVSRFT